MELLELPIEQVHEYGNNPRINDHAVQDMASLIEAHGFRVPVLVRAREGGEWDLVDGHLRIKALRLLGWDMVPSLDVSDMDEDQVTAFRVSINRASELASWDVGKLLAELESMALPEDELPALTGMDDDYLRGLANDAGLPPTEPETTPRNNSSEHRQQSADPQRVQGDDDTVSLSLNMTVARRREVLGRLDALKAEYGVETRAEALCRALLPPAPAPRRRQRRRPEA